MISHKHKFIFVHISKTGGTSIRNAMTGNYDELHDPHHSGISRIKENLSDEIFQSYFKFGTVRNPWEREVSRYKFLGNNKNLPESRYCQGSFKKYLSKFIELGYVNYENLKIDDNIGVDYVMKFENLQEDFNVVCDKIGIPHRQLPHQNKTKQNTNITPNTTMKKQSKSLRKNMQKTLNILITNLEHKLCTLY